MLRERIIRFFVDRHLLTNLFFVAVFVGGIIAWRAMPKEELPDVTFDMVRIGCHYPGASTDEVEYYVTRPIEEALRGLDGIYRISSSTAVGSSNVSVEIEKNADLDEVIAEIRNEVLDVDLPDDIIDEPEVRVFKTSRKAIVDVGLIIGGVKTLDSESRAILQAYALALENNLLSLPQVSSVSRSGYLNNEIHIEVHPDKLIEYQIPFNTVIREIKENNVRQPAGSIENIREPKVTLTGELGTIDELKNLAVQGGFEGQVVRLGDIADVAKGYEKTKSLFKINGHEGIFLNVVKSSSVGIIDAIKAVRRVTDNFQVQSELAEGAKLKVHLLDDESVDVQNRLRLISINGMIGFILIVTCLFIFLDFRSGIWVAMGIPFTFCFTLIVALFCGYTINNVTLAAVIIVMGMVVDDAIVVSENISRFQSQGVSRPEAAVTGTAFVFTPIIASILTTCVAFVPLFFFSGHFGAMVTYIPLIVCFMLGGSLIEALFILPGHMAFSIGAGVKRYFQTDGRSSTATQNHTKKRKHWFRRCEYVYARFIEKVLHYKWLWIFFFIGLLVFSGSIAINKMKFVMFPDEETRQIRLTAQAPAGTQKYETARLAQPLEDVISGHIGKEVVGFRSAFARTRRGSAAQENLLQMRIEIVPKDKREKSADTLIQEWEAAAVGIPGLEKVRFSKSWHGQSSASPIELTVKENNDRLRQQLSDELAQELKRHPALMNVEIDRPFVHPEYQITLDRDKIRRLSISPTEVATTLRAALEGKILYELMGDDEQIYVRLTTDKKSKDSIDKVLALPVENKGQYLVPLKDIVFVKEIVKPDTLNREDLKRTTSLYADLRPGTQQTPLEIAAYYEETVFPKIIAGYPSSIVEFAGEIKDSRESGQDFKIGIVLVIGLIYMVLVILFNSLSKPFIIMVTIPFGLVGIILAFWLHGITLYGFFAVIGALGLAGVVINDAIIMVVKLDTAFDSTKPIKSVNRQISSIAKTRLRAVLLTTLTTIMGIIPSAYGWAGYDSMLAQMMLALGWGLLFGTAITLILIPCVYCIGKRIHLGRQRKRFST